jgi:FG-GAP-like repeat
MASSLCAFVFVMLSIGFDAQTVVPIPNFALTFHPQLYFNLWPGDFNEDGRTDLVATTRGGGAPEPADLVVLIGRGDGTFGQPRPVGLTAVPLVVTDLNADALADVVVLRGTALEVLSGNGDGTFDPPRLVATHRQFSDLRAWGVAADFDRDGHRDLVVPEYTALGDTLVLKLYPGNGDFTFDAPVNLPLPIGSIPAADAISGDFNRDGRRDLAVANVCCEISVFLNRGGRTFARSDLVDATSMYTDITTGDLNRDGMLDLVASSGRHDMFYSYTDGGQVFVFLGNGDGTFQPRTGYDTGVRGETSVVVGDFNADSRLDVATGNRSLVDQGDGIQLGDSISILPGDGAGRLLRASTYALSTVNLERVNFNPNYPYLYAHHQMNISDLNADGRTDLIASPGVTLLNRPPAANRPPAVFAGPDRTEFFFDAALWLHGEAADPDNHWLTYTWTNQSGQVIGRLPSIRTEHPRGTTRTYTLTVDDGHGGRASDAVTIRVPQEGDPFIAFDRPAPGALVTTGQPYTVAWSVFGDVALEGFALSSSTDDGRTFAIVPGCGNLGPAIRQCTWTSPGPATGHARLRLLARGSGDWITISAPFQIGAGGPQLPAGWTAVDIGSVGARGTTSFASGRWTVEGSGADIWGTADEFRYVYRPIASNFSFTTRVASLEDLHRWEKAGIMIREDLSPGSRHLSLFATPRTENGIAFQLRRHLNGTSESIAGPAVAPPVWLKVGRVGDTVSAYYRTSLSQTWRLVARQTMTALRTSVYVGLALTSHVDGSLATAVFDRVSLEAHPVNLTDDVGNVGVPGTTTFDGVVYELQGSGADIWGTADAFRFAYSRFYSPGSVTEITARVRSVEPTHHWAKAGVMFRETPAAGSRHVMVVVTPGRGISMQYRLVSGGLSAQAAVRPGIAPEWVRLSRSGNTFTGYASEDGVTWHTLATITNDMFAEPGLVVTSHDNATLGTARFEDVQLVTPP